MKEHGAICMIPTSVDKQQPEGRKVHFAKEQSSSSQQQHAAATTSSIEKCPGEVAFFKMLHAELKKCIHFFNRAEQEFTIREERVREAMEIVRRPNSIMVDGKWCKLATSIYRLYKDLLLLETYAIMSYCSFSKILKKHDQVTGYATRQSFMENVVSKASFTTYPHLLDMISRCERLYDEVSGHLFDAGRNHGLYEDERLFIDMVRKLNGHVLDSAESSEGVKVQDAQQERTKVSATEEGTPVLKTESEATFSLRSIVKDMSEKLDNAVDDDSDDEEIDPQLSEGARKRLTGERSIMEELESEERKRPRNI